MKKRYLVILILLFLALKLGSIHYRFGDENIYFFMAKNMLEGELPYKDFFFASPPLQLLIISLFFGKSIFLAKLIPILASIITAVLLFRMGKGISKLAAPCFFLFSTIILSTTDHSTGISLTIMFVTISYYFLDKNQITSGAFLGMAALTRLYGGVFLLGFAAYLLYKKKYKGIVKLVSGFSMVFLLLIIISAVVFDVSILEQIFLYHLQKPGVPFDYELFFSFALQDIILVALALVGVASKLRKFHFGLAAGLLFLALFTDIYYLYFGLLMPFLAIAASNARISGKIIYVIMIVFIITNSLIYYNFHASQSELEPREITQFIIENSDKNELIYGSSEITPLIAYKTDRDILDNQIDSNPKVFASDMKNIEELNWHKLKFFILLTKISEDGKTYEMEEIIDEEFLKTCSVARVFRINYYDKNAVIVFDCDWHRFI